MPRRNHGTIAMITNFEAAGLATHRTNPSTQARLDAALVTHASCLLLSVPDLSKDERQFLYDIRRQEGRIATKGWARLLDLTVRSHRASHRRQLGRIFDRTELQPEVYAGVWAASLRETERQGTADIAMQELLSDPSATAREKAVMAHKGHRAALDQLITELERLPVAA